MSGGRVFCIGLNKTATTSVHTALTTLGYRSLHWGGPEARRAVRRAMAEGLPLLTHVDPEPEAVSDLEEVTHNFELADRQYAQSRFVLTVRDLEAWLDSRRRHVEHNRRERDAGRYRGRFLDVDLDAWAAERRRHHARVQAYFARRPDDLLVWDVAADPRWEPLCEFLGHPVPPRPFPHENERTAAAAAQAGDRAFIAQRAE